MKHFKNFICGLILGIVNIIPGLSGGTMAVILNIYDDILYAISWKTLRKNAAFLLALIAGCGAGLLFAGNVILFFIENYSYTLHYCFIGLILGSIPSIYRRARYERLKKRNLIPLSISFIFMAALAVFNQGPLINPADSPGGAGGLLQFVWLFFATCFSVIGMILPGISGSFLMILFGTYSTALEALTELDILLLIPIASGGLSGLYIGVKGVKKLLRFHPQALYMAILGLVTGSVLIVYPGFRSDLGGAIALLLMVVSALSVYLFSKRTHSNV